VIVGPDGAPWITDGGLNAIVRVDPATSSVQRFPLPPERAAANLNTATFDRNGILWFTGQSGVYGRLNPADGSMEVWSAPRGNGPYGITTTPGGEVYYASLAGHHIAHVNLETGEATPIDPPTTRQGARRVWSDSEGADLGERVEFGAGRPVRPGDGCLARVEAARQRADDVRRLRGR
jgi:virginiamycin B lyase